MKPRAKNSQPSSIGVKSVAETKHSTLAVSETEDAKNAPSANLCKLGKQSDVMGAHRSKTCPLGPNSQAQF